MSGAAAVAVRGLLQPMQFVSRQEAIDRASPVPISSGAYAWYFDEAPVETPAEDAHRVDRWTLHYVGISPRRPRASDGRPSAGHLRSRIRTHYSGDASRSTLRMSLGSLLREQLALSLQRHGGSTRLTFGEGENVLSEWMASHTRVCWVEHDEPWLIEDALISTVSLSLNLQGNRSGTDLDRLKSARREARRLAATVEAAAN